MAFKFLKKQTKSENHEICRDIMILYVETVATKWGGFAKVDTYVVYKLEHLRSPKKFHRVVRNLLRFGVHLPSHLGK